MMEASKQADPEKEPVDLVEACTRLLSQLTDGEINLLISTSFQEKSAEDQLLLFYRAVRCGADPHRAVSCTENLDRFRLQVHTLM
jgi:hypothetical protein